MSDIPTIDVANASRKELFAFARDELGLKLAFNTTDEALRQKVADQLEKGVQPRPIRRTVSKVEEVAPLRDIPIEETSVIMIMDDQGPKNVDPVPVVVNGRAYHIRRNRKVRVPNFVVKVLANAVETRYHQENPGEENSKMIARRVPSYPFQVLLDEVGENDEALLAGAAQ